MKILALGAHPDDIEIYMFGALAAWASSGTALEFAIATDGAKGGGGDPAVLGRTRREEAMAAAALLHVKPRFLDFSRWRPCRRHRSHRRTEGADRRDTARPDRHPCAERLSRRPPRAVRSRPHRRLLHRAGHPCRHAGRSRLRADPLYRHLWSFSGEGQGHSCPCLARSRALRRCGRRAQQLPRQPVQRTGRLFRRGLPFRPGLPLRRHSRPAAARSAGAAGPQPQYQRRRSPLLNTSTITPRCFPAAPRLQARGMTSASRMRTPLPSGSTATGFRSIASSRSP